MLLAVISQFNLPAQIIHSPVYLSLPLCIYREYSDVCRWSSFQHRKMSNATPPASKDLFSTVPCYSDWQWTVELPAIRFRAPLSTVSRSCSEQLKTPSSLASGVAFVPIFRRWIFFQSHRMSKRHCKPVHQSQSQNCAIFTSNIWSILWKTNILFFLPKYLRLPVLTKKIIKKKNCVLRKAFIFVF